MSHRIHLAFLALLLLMAVPLACSKTYYLGPLATTPTPVFTPSYSSTPVFTPTSTCTGRLVTTLAGHIGAGGAVNGTGTAASFNYPQGVGVDTAGNVYVADSDNHMIRKIDPGGVVTTLAGSGAEGNTNGTGTAASFYFPSGVAADLSGNVYVADTGNNLIREISPGGIVTTLAGSGAEGAVNGTGTAASFFMPRGVAVDSAGNVYVGDSGNNMIRKITPGGLVSTLAGSGSYGSSDGTGTAASFASPQGIALDTAGNIYVADTNDDLIRWITPGGVVSTAAGSAWVAGSNNGTGSAATFDNPTGVAVDGSGDIYVADLSNDLIREIAPGGVVTTLAGTLDEAGCVNGNAACALFYYPNEVAEDSAGNLYVVESHNNMIRKISP